MRNLDGREKGGAIREQHSTGSRSVRRPGRVSRRWVGFLALAVAISTVGLATGANGAVPVQPGEILVIDQAAGTSGLLFVVNPITGERRVLSDFGDGTQGPVGVAPGGLALEQSGGILVVDQNAGTDTRGALFRVNPNDGSRTLVTDFGNSQQGTLGNDPRDAAVEASGQILIIYQNGGGTGSRGSVHRVDPTTGNRTLVTIFDAISDPWRVAVEASGTILVTDSNGGTDQRGALYRIDPATGNVLRTFDFGNAAEGDLGVDPLGQAVEASGNILVADRTAGPAGGSQAGAVFRVDGTTGQRVLLSDFFDPAQGPIGVDPFDVAVLSNTAPVVEDQTFTVAENSANGTVVGTIVVTDPDPGDALAFAVTGGSGQGVFNVDAATGEITVADSAQLNFEASPSFTLNITVTDSGTPPLSDTAVITKNVTNVNEAPVANDDNYTTNEDTPLTVPFGTGILANNDVDPDAGTTLTAQQVAGPSNGTLTLNADGSFAYTPNANFNGTDSFTYQAFDGALPSNIATVTITVRAVNDAPTLNPIGNLSIVENAGPQTVNLTGIGSGAANETQTLTVTASSNNTGLIPNPTVTYTSPSATGTLTFTPVAGQNGTATITVTVTDDGGTANGGVNTFARTFTVTVIPIAGLPTVTATAPDPFANEAGLTTGKFRVSRAGSMVNALTVFYTVGGNATPGSDYVALPGSVTIPAGQSSADIFVTPLQDNLQELPETITITLSSNTGYTIGSPGTAAVFLRSDDDISQIASVFAPDSTATEAGLTRGTFRVVRIGSVSASLTVSYMVGGTATPWSDYETLPGSVTIAAGRFSADIQVNPFPDGEQETPETIVLTMTQSQNYAVGIPASATVTLESDE